MDDRANKRIQNIIAQRNLSSYMNNTKWKELQDAMLQTMPFPLPYIMKTLFEENCSDEIHFQKDVCYLGDWDEAMPSYCYAMIEWIKVRPRYLKYRGRLIEPDCIDASEEFETILTYYNIPYEIDCGVYCIYGYK